MKNKIKNILYALLGSIAFSIYFNNSYDFLISLIFFLLLFLFFKTDQKFSFNSKRMAIILGIILATIFSIGNQVAFYMWSTPVVVFTLRNIFKALFLFLGFYLVIYRLSAYVMTKSLPKIKIFNNNQTLNKKHFLFIWLVLFLCWVPYLLRFYPAIMSPDSYYVIHYANNFILSDLHTFGHTWFFGLFFHIGKLLTGNLNFGIFLSILVQMIILSLIFTFMLKKLYNMGLNKNVWLLILLYYALSPLHAHYSVTLWRDILFGGVFVTISLIVFDYINNDYHLTKANWLLLILSLLVLLFFRNNGIYVFIIAILLLMIFMAKRRVLLAGFGLIISISYFVIKGPVFNYFGIAATKPIEAYSIPLQQISRTIALDGNINAEEKKYLQEIMDYEKVGKTYSQVSSDPIKGIADGYKISENKGKFFKTWTTLLLKNPRSYFEAYFLETLGYWYPTVEYYATLGESKGIFEEKVGNTPLVGENFKKIIDLTSSRKIPLNNFIWSIGTYVIVFIISLVFLLYNKNKKYLGVYIPVLSLWLTIMISTPVFAELRYIYGLFCTIPLLMVLPFYKKN